VRVVWDEGGVGWKTCPGYGEGVRRVGSNFRISKKRDAKGWGEVEGIIEKGGEFSGELFWRVRRYRSMGRWWIRS